MAAKRQVRKVPRISDAEWVLMRILWADSPLPIADIAARLPKTQAWHRKTVTTLVNRLVDKGAVGFKRDGRRHLYFPSFSEDECIAAESDAFVQRLFGGSINPMLANWFQNRKLSKREIEELKKMVDEL